LNLVEQVCAVLGDEAAPEILSMLPQYFNMIELRAAGRKIVQTQPVFGPLTLFLLDQVALVNAGIVDQNDASNRMRLERHLIEKGNHVCLISCDHVPRRSWHLFRAKAMLGDLIAEFSSPGNQSHQEQFAA
jgi:hypothetical protein